VGSGGQPSQPGPLHPPGDPVATDQPPEPAPWRPGELRDRPPPRAPHAPPSLAQTRGDNWGLRDVARGSFPVTRPIRIGCDAQGLTVHPARDGPPTFIPFDGSTARSVDALVSSIWEHTEAWGIAGRGMYWRPILQVEVAPSGQQRFAELEALLDDSGLTLERREAPARSGDASARR
jgi:hypothetical protein